MTILARNGAVTDATVRSAASGDEAALADLVASHHASMARVAFVVCGDVELTRDVVQTAWAIAWRRIGSLRDPGQVRPWLVAIAANEARQAVRRRRRANVIDISRDLRDPRADPTESVELMDLEVALQRLRPDDRSLSRCARRPGSSRPRSPPRSGCPRQGFAAGSRASWTASAWSSTSTRSDPDERQARVRRTPRRAD